MKCDWGAWRCYRRLRSTWEFIGLTRLVSGIPVRRLARRRVPFVIRWPGKGPAAYVANEIVHAIDMFATFANAAGGDVPDDRVIDSVDRLDFLTGNRDKSNRDGFSVLRRDTLPLT